MLRVEKIEFNYSDLGHVLGMKVLVKNISDSPFTLLCSGMVTSKRENEIFEKKSEGKAEQDRVVLQPGEEKELSITLDPAVKLVGGTFAIAFFGGIWKEDNVKNYSLKV